MIQQKQRTNTLFNCVKKQPCTVLQNKSQERCGSLNMSFPWSSPSKHHSPLEIQILKLYLTFDAKYNYCKYFMDTYKGMYIGPIYLRRSVLKAQRSQIVL